MSANGQSLAVARGRELLLLDAASGAVRAKLPAGEHRWNAVACLADGRVVAAGGTPGQGGEWLVWNPTQPGEPRRVAGHADTIHALDVHRREPWLLTASYDRELRLWNLETGAGMAVLKHHTGPVQAARFGPAEGQVVSGAADQTVKLWQVPAGERLATFSEATRGVQAVACHPASALFAAAGADRSLRLYRWDGQQAVLVRSSLAHDSPVLALAFSPDGQTLYSAAEDHVLKAWQVEPLRERHVYPALPDWPLALAVSPGGDWMACGLADGSLRLFDTATPRQRAEWLQAALPAPPPARPETAVASVANAPARAEDQPDAAPVAAPPPRLDGVSPRTVVRGQMVTLTLSGANLERLDAVDCASAGLVPRLLDPQVADKAATQRQVSLEIPADWSPGAVQLRVRGPGGSSQGRTLFIGSLTELAEKEPNNLTAEAQAVTVPAQLHGTISARGDVDRFRVELVAGQPMVLLFANTGHGSALQPRLLLRDGQGRTVAQTVRRSHRGEVVLGFTATEAGPYEIEISDRDNTGGGNHVYWLQLGALPVVTEWFPLGLRGLDRGDRLPGEPDQIFLRGLLLDPDTAQRPVAALGSQASRPTTAHGLTLNAAQFESSPFAELVEHEPNAGLAEALSLPVPGGVSGRIEPGAGGGVDEDLIAFDAVAGEPLWLEILARRRGSPLDSLLEILDAQGRPLGRHTLRAVSATYTELRDHDSRVRGIRLHNWEDFLPGDLLLLGGELARIQVLPLGPDEDLKFYERGGVRLGYLGTTPEAHALNRPVYKVELHPAGTTLPPNGLPQVALAWRNDDGGPEFQADSALVFE
ncbi:MAG: WD40 repeat domain-containing protein, partial [Planctomycetaceae bacterium]